MTANELIHGRYLALNEAMAELRVTVSVRDVHDMRPNVAACVLIYEELLYLLSDDGTEISDYLDGLYRYQIQLLLDLLYDGEDEQIHTLSKVAIGLLQAWEDEIGIYT